jgi:DnaJ-class molecular chaperone
MAGYQEIDDARRLLGLPERASMREIKAAYRRLLGQWHPDRCAGDEARCAEMTRRLIAAHEVLIAYCRGYRYSFTKEEVSSYGSDEDWWLRRFGNDPLWGSAKKGK